MRLGLFRFRDRRRCRRGAARHLAVASVWLALSAVALTGCGGGGGGSSPPAGNSGGGGSGGGGSGGGPGGGGGGAGGGGGNGGGDGTGGGGSDGTLRPLHLTLEAGDFLEFLWVTESRTFAQPGTTATTVDVGRFRLTLGQPELIGGREAFPLEIIGDPGELGPRWTHIAVDADGSLLGATDETGLTTIYDAASDAWAGGGMFVDFAESRVEVSLGQFDGTYHSMPAIVVGRSDERARCEQILGQTICGDEATTFSEREFYKEGVGPIGYALHIHHEDDGGGFFSSHTIDTTLELIDTSLVAADGSVFVRPPWEDVAPLDTAREGHAAVALDGKIWVIGGWDKDGNGLAGVEIYDPIANEWSEGPALPRPLGDVPAVAIAGKIYVVAADDEVLVHDPDTGWSSTTPQFSPGIPLWDAAYWHDTIFGFGEVLIGASLASSIAPVILVGGYDPAGDQWLVGGDSLQWAEALRFTVEVVGDSMFVIGGFGQSGTGPSERGALDSVMEFDLAAESWVTAGVGRLKAARDNHASAVLDGRVYVFGGNPVTCNAVTCTPQAPLREAEVYDPAAGESAELPPMFRARKRFAAVAMDGAIYVIGGSDGGQPLDSVERFTP